MRHILYANGICSGNPGPGGYAWKIWCGHAGDESSEVSGSERAPETTSNAMKLAAARGGLRALCDMGAGSGDRIVLRLDPGYVLDGIFVHMPTWKSRGWKTSRHDPIKNQSLWQDVDALMTALRRRGAVLERPGKKGCGDDAVDRDVTAEAMRVRDMGEIPSVPRERESSADKGRDIRAALADRCGLDAALEGMSLAEIRALQDTFERAASRAAFGGTDLVAWRAVIDTGATILLNERMDLSPELSEAEIAGEFARRFRGRVVVLRQTTDPDVVLDAFDTLPLRAES